MLIILVSNALHRVQAYGGWSNSTPALQTNIGALSPHDQVMPYAVCCWCLCAAPVACAVFHWRHQQC